ncbi:MATE family efflux transporter, partial [Escherichia coli]
SPQDLAAVGLGNSIWIPVYLLMSGTLLATTPKVAQRYGAGQYREIGPLVRQSLWLALMVGIIGSLLLLCAEPILHAMKVEPDLIA